MKNGCGCYRFGPRAKFFLPAAQQFSFAMAGSVRSLFRRRRRILLLSSGCQLHLFVAGPGVVLRTRKLSPPIGNVPSQFFSSDGIGEDDGTIISSSSFRRNGNRPSPTPYENIMRRRNTIVSFLPSLTSLLLPVPNSFSLIPIIDPAAETLHNIDPSLLPFLSPAADDMTTSWQQLTRRLTRQLTFLLFSTNINQTSYFWDGQGDDRDDHFAFFTQPKVKLTRLRLIRRHKFPRGICHFSALNEPSIPATAQNDGIVFLLLDK